MKMITNECEKLFLQHIFIQDKEVEQGGSAPRILSLDDYFLVEKEIETKDDNGKKVIMKVLLSIETIYCMQISKIIF